MPTDFRFVGPAFEGFAENDLVHEDSQASVPTWVGDGLRAALWHYKEGLELKRDVREWFPERTPKPKVKKTWVKQILESASEEDHSRMERKFVWIGGATGCRSRPGRAIPDHVAESHNG